MKQLLWLGIVSALSLGLVAPSATARVAMETSTGKGSGSADSQTRKSGVIGDINLGLGTMEVGGVVYLYNPSLTRTFKKSGVSSQVVNPLSLRSESQVEFLTKKEGAKERITDLWVIWGKP